MTPEDIKRYEDRREACVASFKADLGDEEFSKQADLYEIAWARVMLREFWLTSGADEASIAKLEGLSAQDLEAFIKTNPAMDSYLAAADKYEQNTGGPGKYLTAGCKIDWSAIACTAYVFANNPAILQAAAAGDYSFTNNMPACPSRLQGESGPQFGKEASYAPWIFGGLAVAGIGTWLLMRKNR